MKALWVTPVRIGPLIHGNMAYQSGIVDLFIRNSCSVDMIYYGGWDIDSNQPLPYRKLWQVLDKRKASRHEWMEIDDWVADELLDFAFAVGSRETYDYVVVDYVWMSRVLELACFRNSFKIIVGHDIFADRSLVFKKIGLKPDWFHTTRDEETRGLKRADLIIAITDADRAYYEKCAPEVKALTWFAFDIMALPNFRPARNLTLGYMASNNPLNTYAIKRFFSILDRELPQFKYIDFVVAGKICEKFGSYKNLWIHKLGWLPDKKKFFDKCDLVVMPMPESTGLKIKSLDALAYGKPFLCTRDVGSGIGSDNPYHNYASIDELAFAVTDMAKTGALLQAGQKLVPVTRQLAENIFLKSHAGKLKLSETLFGKNGRRRKYVSASVIIPVFNGESTIAACLDSVLADRLENKEIIVIDDCSEDATIERLKEYEDRIILLRQPANLGQGAARNRGLEIAAGEFVYFVDADDTIGPDSIYHMYNQAIADDLDICLINIKIFKNRDLNLLPAFAAWGGLIRKLILDAHEIRQPDLRTGQDGVFSNMVLAFAAKIAICDKAGYNYTNRADGTFLRHLADYEKSPGIVEKQLDILFHFYRELHFSMERLLLYVYEETFKFRLKQSFNLLHDSHSRKIYYMIKQAYFACLQNCDQNIVKNFGDDFRAIMKYEYDEWFAKYYNPGFKA